MSFVIWKVLPDNPETTIPSNVEKEIVLNRIALETGSGQGRVTNVDRIRMHHIIAAFSDWKIWCGVVAFWTCTIGTYGFVLCPIPHSIPSSPTCVQGQV